MLQSSSSRLRTAGLLGALAVVIGAFGAHGLKPHLDAYQLSVFEKGVQYQFYHSFALALTALASPIARHQNRLKWAGWLFALGILLFSGSLFLLGTRELLPFSVTWAGPVTPLGGLCFIGGWVFLALSSWGDK